MPFINDLLRRRVPQVAAIYLGACWAAVEFTDFVAQRFALSSHIVDMALIVPLLLLPSVILVTYLHGAPGYREWGLAEKIGISLNGMVAAGILVFFFQGKDLGAATTTVVVTDEEGVETEREIPKDEFRKRITVYFFEAEPADSAAGWMQFGFPIAIVNDLGQDQFLNLQMPIDFSDRLREAGFEGLVGVPLPLAREIAEERHRDHFVTGSVAVVDGEIQATVSLYDSSRGSLVAEHSYSGRDLMTLADEVSIQLKEDLELPEWTDDQAQDLPVADLLTNDPSAYRLSVEAMIAMEVDRDFVLGTSLMEEAVALDPTYADAQSSLGNLYLFTNRGAEAAAPLQAAMDHLYRLPERARFVVKSNYYLLVRQDMERALAALEMWVDLFPDDLQAFQARLQIQTLQNDKIGSRESLERILELDPGQRDVLLQIGDIHQAMGDLNAAEEVYRQYSEEFPESYDALARLAGLSSRAGNLDQARTLYDRALILAPSDVTLIVAMGGVEQLAGNFSAALELFEEAMATAGTPAERSQVFSALEALHRIRGQNGLVVEYLNQRLSVEATYQPALLLGQRKVLDAANVAEAGQVEAAFAMVEEGRAELSAPFDRLAYVGELAIYVTIEDAEAIEATIPAVESLIADLQYGVFQPLVVRAQGLVHELRGEYREAIGRYEEEQRLSPSTLSVPMRLARCHRELGEYDQAVSLLQETLGGSPFAPRTNYELALTFEAMDRLEEALIHVERAIGVWEEADPDHKWAGLAREMVERLES